MRQNRISDALQRRAGLWIRLPTNGSKGARLRAVGSHGTRKGTHATIADQDLCIFGYASSYWISWVMDHVSDVGERAATASDFVPVRPAWFSAVTFSFHQSMDSAMEAWIVVHVWRWQILEIHRTFYSNKLPSTWMILEDDTWVPTCSRAKGWDSFLCWWLRIRSFKLKSCLGAVIFCPGLTQFLQNLEYRQW
jgi:hypothetical protein